MGGVRNECKLVVAERLAGLGQDALTRTLAITDENPITRVIARVRPPIASVR